MSSVYEAIYNAVPVVAVPMFYDQFHNANLLVHRLNIGVKLDFNTINEEELEAAIDEVTNNIKYTKNVKTLSDALLADSVLYKRIFLHIADYVIRYNGAKHLISEAALQLTILQLNNIDVVLILLVSFVSALTMVYISLKFILKMAYRWIGN